MVDHIRTRTRAPELKEETAVNPMQWDGSTNLVYTQMAPQVLSYLE